MTSANKLYFAQHGQAVDKAENPERPLSAIGISETLAIAKQLHAASTPISQIFHSGKLRAAQTADIFAETLGITMCSATEHLSPNDPIDLLISNLIIDDALYIGHLPHLDKLTSYLVTGKENTNVLQFQNSAVVCLEKSDDRYAVQWYITQTLLNNT